MGVSGSKPRQRGSEQRTRQWKKPWDRVLCTPLAA